MEPLQERLAGFLRSRPGQAFCLDCLAAEFDLPHAETREAVAAVALVVPDVQYVTLCSRCGARSGLNSVVGAHAA
jgi:hypothetical protein